MIQDKKKTDIPDFMAKAVLWNKGPKVDDFSVGESMWHHWGRTITASDNSVFSTLSQMYNPIYFNEVYARHQGHQSTVVCPFLVFNIVFGLSVEDLSENRSLFLGIDKCKFLQTVYVGDTLRAKSDVLAIRKSNSDPTRQIVTWKTKGFNQKDELIIEYTRSNIFIAGLMGKEPDGAQGN